MELTNIQKYSVVEKNDTTYDGEFYYAVKTTGIFCRPSCKSKLPKYENVIFFNTAQEAIAQGYRACKRCRSDLLNYDPVSEDINRCITYMHENFDEEQCLDLCAQRIGYSRKRMNELFVAKKDITVCAYLSNIRLQYVLDQLENTEKAIVEIASSIGINSVSSFYVWFKKRKECTPGEYRASLIKE